MTEMSDTTYGVLVAVQTILLVLFGYWMVGFKPWPLLMAGAFGGIAANYAMQRGIPLWIDGGSMGDAYDIGFLVFLIVCYCRGDQ